MYILISIFAAYAVGIISYEHGFFIRLFTAVFIVLVYNSIATKRFIYKFVIIAFLILAFINCNYNSKFVLKQYVNEEADISAKIKTQNKATDSEFMSYNASVMSINNVSLKEEENTIIYVNKKYPLEENSIVQFKGSIAGSNFSKNRMLFNYDNYLRSKKIGAVIFTEEPVNVIEKDFSALNKISIGFRNYAENTFYNSLSKENADIILSIILGDVDYLDENLYDNIKLMGLAHIFAVSGTHIVLMYGTLLSALKFCCLSRKASWAITWAVIWFYGFLIGFPLTVMRALVMFTLLFGAEVFYKKYNSLNSIAMAALVLTVYNPYWIFDAGFLLSFSAALSLVIYNKYITNQMLNDNMILRNVYMCLFLQLFTLPVIAYYFNYAPVMGILYNLLLLPVFTVVLIYGFTLLIINAVIPALLAIPFAVFNYILHTLRFIIKFTEKFAFNGVEVATMSVGAIIFFYVMVAFVIYLYSNRESCVKTYGLTVLISFYTLNFIIATAADDSLYFNVADAGQGVFTTVKYSDKNFIIDCGSTSSDKFGKYTAVPYMTKHGAFVIDGVFISHWDSDHYSGLRELAESYIKVRKIFSSSDDTDIGEEITVLSERNKLKLGRLGIDILWPEENYTASSANNSSLVILLRFNDSSIMLAGDIEKEAEEILTSNIEHSDILIVPHHGSKTSSTADFVEKVLPDIAVLSYGRNNYGIPSKEVIERYEKAGSNVLSTFDQGEINFILKGDKIYYNTYTNEKSDNYYELYFTGIIPNLMNFCLLMIWIIKNKGERYELQNYNRYD
ncbi:MAG TPA: DNA internalization-related competence protein ComEC/Rec2 [Clostridiales bacterium]|nr:DNA internalization-related competence protein ComEC/Rec2 [Clostridiales bacterium]